MVEHDALVSWLTSPAVFVTAQVAAPAGDAAAVRPAAPSRTRERRRAAEPMTGWADRFFGGEIVAFRMASPWAIALEHQSGAWCSLPHTRLGFSLAGAPLRGAVAAPRPELRCTYGGGVIISC